MADTKHMSDTPRTDALYEKMAGKGAFEEHIALGNFCCQLERENADLLAALKVLLYEYSLQMEDENLKGDPDLDFDQFAEVIQARAAIAKAEASHG